MLNELKISFQSESILTIASLPSLLPEEICVSVEEGLPFDSSKVRRKMMTDRPVGNPDFPSGHPFSKK